VQPSRNRLIRTWIGSERGENGKTRVTFVWEPVPKAAGASAAETRETPARVALTVSGSDGTPYFRGRVPSTPPPLANALAPSRITFEVPPGALQLRLSVEDASSEVLDSDNRQITVPDLTTPQTALATPEVFRARTIRDLQQLKADPQALPTTVREFSRTERLLIRVAAYAPGGGSPNITARLLNRTGQPMNPLEVVRPASGGDAEIDIALAGLATGEYVLEITATGEAGESKELVAFRITG
jgi:hypothetical protein